MVSARRAGGAGAVRGAVAMACSRLLVAGLTVCAGRLSQGAAEIASMALMWLL